MRTSQTRSGSPMWQSSVCLGRSCICPQFSICTAAIWSAIPYRIALCSAWWQPCWTRHLQKFQTEQTSFSIFLWAAQKWAAVFAGVPLHGALQTGTRCISGLLQHPQNQGKTEGLAACNSQTTSPFGCLNNFYFKILSNFLGSLHAACLLFITGFSVVRRHTVPSDQRPFYCIAIGFFRCPPTFRPKVRHQFRILGASRTRGMTPSVHFHYMHFQWKSQRNVWRKSCLLAQLTLFAAS